MKNNTTEQNDTTVDGAPKKMNSANDRMEDGTTATENTEEMEVDEELEETDEELDDDGDDDGEGDDGVEGKDMNGENADDRKKGSSL